MKRRIRIAACNFWPTYHTDLCPILNLLRTRYDVEISDQPDYLLYSVFGEQHYRYRCPRIFFSGEPIGPNWNECDFAFTSFALDDPRHHRLPLFWLNGDMRALLKPEQDVEQILRSKTKFCNFVVSNPKCEARNRFFELLSQYNRVDSGGKYRNNLGYRVPDKSAFIRDYKFTIAFENSAHAGYTTEKIVEPMLAESLPIYWGNPLIHLDFNTRSFLSYDDYGSLEKLVARVIELDQNDELYLEYLRQPWFVDNRIPDHLHGEVILEKFDRIFAARISPVAQRVPVPLYTRARTQWRAARTWLKGRLRTSRSA